MPDITSDAMRRAIDGWFDAWFSRVPPDEEDPCQRIPYAVVNKLGKAVFAEYDSSLEHRHPQSGNTWTARGRRSTPKSASCCNGAWWAARRGPSRCLRRTA